MWCAAAFVDRGRRMMHKCYNLYTIVEMLTTRDGPAVIDAKARYFSKIAIFFPSYGVPIGILLSSSFHHHFFNNTVDKRFGTETLEWSGRLWLPDGENSLTIRSLVSTEHMNVTDRQTDNARRHRPCLCTASRDKNLYFF